MPHLGDMANNYVIHTANDSIKCSEEMAGQLSRLLEEGRDDHGFEADFGDGRFYVFAEQSGTPDELPKAFLAKFGEALKAAGLQFLEFGYACTCDRCRPGSHSGGSYRICADGTIVWPETVWPA